MSTLLQTENDFDPTGAVEYSRDERAARQYDENEYDETEDHEFDPEVEPAEYGCNSCGWSGYPSSSIVMCGGETIESLACPVCRVYREVSEWNIVSADPFEQPLEDGEADLAALSEWLTHFGSFPLLQALIEQAAAAKKPAGRQQGELFEGVA